jgi:hypothetical protein
MTAELEIKGLDEVQQYLAKFPAQINADLQSAMKGAAALVKSRLNQYPPLSEANTPPGPNGYSWYERGYGVQTVTGKGYPVSKVLGRSWTSVVKGEGMDVKGIIGTPVSYAPFVHDERRQASFHRRRGWQTAQAVLDKNAPVIQEFFDKMIERIIARVS